MKIYYVCAATIFIAAYAVFHFAFSAGGDGRLYKINDRLAFELHTPNENFNGVVIRSVRPTNGFIKFICGACEADGKGAIEMLNVKYRRDDFIYTDFPQHEHSTADIINVKTGETINAQVPADFNYGDDFSKLPEYSQLNLTASAENKLTADYVKTNFEPLSTFTNRCLYANLIFAVIALFLAFPNLFIMMLDALSQATDPTGKLSPRRRLNLGDLFSENAVIGSHCAPL